MLREISQGKTKAELIQEIIDIAKSRCVGMKFPKMTPEEGKEEMRLISDYIDGRDRAPWISFGEWVESEQGGSSRVE